VEITNVDPDQPVEIEVSLSGMTAKSAAGETLTAPEVDSVNNFEAPNTVGLGEVGDDGTFVTRSWPLFSNFDRNHLPAFLREVLRQDRLPGEAVFSDLSFVMCGGPDSDIDLTTPAGTTACPCVEELKVRVSAEPMRPTSGSQFLFMVRVSTPQDN